MNLTRLVQRLGRWVVFFALVLTIGIAWRATADQYLSQPPGKRLLLFVGSNTLGERTVPELAEGYLKSQKQATQVVIQRTADLIYVTGRLPDGGAVYIEIHPTGSGDCFQSFLGNYSAADKACDIGMSSRRVRQSEADAIKEKLGSDFFMQGTEPGQGCEHPMGMDGVAIVVRKDVPISRISFSELKAIYSRSMTDWSQTADWKDSGASGKGLPIAPFRRKEPSGTLDFFKDRINPDPAPMADETVIPAFVSSGDLVARVAGTPGGIGFVGQGYAGAPGVKRLQVYDDLSPEFMKPEEASFPDPIAVQQEYYPLARVVYFYTPILSVNPEVEPFIKYTLSEEGQAVIAASGSLIKIEGTLHQLAVEPRISPQAAPAQEVPTNGRQKKVILRLAGSNTVGAECAVNLAYNFLMGKRENPSARIEDQTTDLETPEGEKARAHDVMCDLHGDGMWETIQIRPTGSSDAFLGLQNGDCDIGMSSRPISDSEKRDLLPVCGNLTQPSAQFALGLDALAIVVSNANAADKITVEQVRSIFLGESADWSALGSGKGPIQLHTRPDRSGTYKYFCDSVLMGAPVIASAKRHAENSALAGAVAADPAGIGFVPMSAVGTAKTLRVGHEGSQSYYMPTEETVRAGNYPPQLCRYVYLYVPATPPTSFSVAARENWETAREFAEMSQSWLGQVIVANCGFVTDTVMMDEAGQLRRVAGETVPQFLQRLSDLEKKVQLRQVHIYPKLTDGAICPRLLFDFNGSVLTAESRNVIERKLGPWLKMYPAVAKGGLIAEGWADSAGSDEACREVSLKRAQNVAQYVMETLGYQIKAEGKGKSFDPPNDSELNKQQNRRVEIKAAMPITVPEASPTPSKRSARKHKSE